jgi:hypothetical protein
MKLDCALWRLRCGAWASALGLTIASSRWPKQYLNGAESVSAKHLAEAVQYRSLELIDGARRSRRHAAEHDHRGASHGPG